MPHSATTAALRRGKSIFIRVFPLASELRAGAQPDCLRLVVALLEKRITDVDLNRPERGLPVDRNTGRDAQPKIIAHAGGSIAYLTRSVDQAQCAEVRKGRQIDTV